MERKTIEKVKVEVIRRGNLANKCIRETGKSI